LPVWELQEMELVNALYLKVFWKDISLQEAEEQVLPREMPGPSVLRA